MALIKAFEKRICINCNNELEFGKLNYCFCNQCGWFYLNDITVKTIKIKGENKNGKNRRN